MSVVDVAAPHVRVLGSRVAMVSLEETVFRIEEWIRRREGCRRVVVTGFHGLWEAHRDPQLRHILNSADLWIPDGIAPVLAARCRRLGNVARIPGAELMEAFFARADFLGYRSFFYGDTEETLGLLKSALEAKYPGHQVAGTLSPPFGPVTAAEDDEHVRRINQSRPDVLWVGLGLPKQDRWIYEHRHQLDVPVAIGVGAAFRFLSGQVPRAPRWVGNIGCEWAYRLAREPRKCWRRSLIQGPQFLVHMLLELAGLRVYEEGGEAE